MKITSHKETTILIFMPLVASASLALLINQPYSGNIHTALSQVTWFDFGRKMFACLATVRGFIILLSYHNVPN